MRKKDAYMWLGWLVMVNLPVKWCVVWGIVDFVLLRNTRLLNKVSNRTYGWRSFLELL